MKETTSTTSIFTKCPKLRSPDSARNSIDDDSRIESHTSKAKLALNGEQLDNAGSPPNPPQSDKQPVVGTKSKRIQFESSPSSSSSSEEEEDDFVFNKHDVYSSSEEDRLPDANTPVRKKRAVGRSQSSPEYSPFKNFVPLSKQNNPIEFDFKNQFKSKGNVDSIVQPRGQKRKKSAATGKRKTKRRRASAKGKGRGKGRGKRGK